MRWATEAVRAVTSRSSSPSTFCEFSCIRCSAAVSCAISSSTESTTSPGVAALSAGVGAADSAGPCRATTGWAASRWAGTGWTTAGSASVSGPPDPPEKTTTATTAAAAAAAAAAGAAPHLSERRHERAQREASTRRGREPKKRERSIAWERLA